MTEGLGKRERLNNLIMKYTSTQDLFLTSPKCTGSGATLSGVIVGTPPSHRALTCTSFQAVIVLKAGHLQIFPSTSQNWHELGVEGCWSNRCAPQRMMATIGGLFVLCIFDSQIKVKYNLCTQMQDNHTF